MAGAGAVRERRYERSVRRRVDRRRCFGDERRRVGVDGGVRRCHRRRRFVDVDATATNFDQTLAKRLDVVNTFAMEENRP